MATYVTSLVSNTRFSVLSSAPARYSAKLKSGRSRLSVNAGTCRGARKAYLSSAYCLFTTRVLGKTHTYGVVRRLAPEPLALLLHGEVQVCKIASEGDVDDPGEHVQDGEYARCDNEVEEGGTVDERREGAVAVEDGEGGDGEGVGDGVPTGGLERGKDTSRAWQPCFSSRSCCAVACSPSSKCTQISG